MTELPQSHSVPDGSSADMFMHVDPSNTQAIGFYFKGKEVPEKFFSMTCPCGVEHSVRINEFPTVDTPHICGNKNHWFAKFSE